MEVVARLLLAVSLAAHALTAAGGPPPPPPSGDFESMRGTGRGSTAAAAGIPCQVSAADIVFVLDSSNSIWPPDWETQIQFIKNLTSEFVIHPDMTRIGCMTYNDRPVVQWRLNDFSTKEEVLRAFDRIQPSGGNTRTAEAVNFMRTKMFSENWGARRGVAQMAFLFTDGKSWKKAHTVREALMVHILSKIKMFVIGIGDGIDRDELTAISSKGARQYLYTLDDFASLDRKMRTELSIGTCEVAAPVAGSPLHPDIRSWLHCKARRPADIVFITDPYTSNPDNLKKTTEFIKNVVRKMPIGENHYRVAVMPEQSCFAAADSNHSSLGRLYDAKSDAYAALNAFGLPSIKDYMEQARTAIFHANKGKARRKMAVVMMDGQQDDVDGIAEEASKLTKLGVDVLAVGVGPQVTVLDLKKIAPSADNVLQINLHDGSQDIEEVILKKTCGVEADLRSVSSQA